MSSGSDDPNKVETSKEENWWVMKLQRINKQTAQ
jgi:hypothetical protein